MHVLCMVYRHRHRGHMPPHNQILYYSCNIVVFLRNLAYAIITDMHVLSESSLVPSCTRSQSLMLTVHTCSHCATTLSLVPRLYQYGTGTLHASTAWEQDYTILFYIHVLPAA